VEFLDLLDIAAARGTLIGGSRHAAALEGVAGGLLPTARRPVGRDHLVSRSASAPYVKIINAS